MLKLVKYLKPFLFGVLAAVALLFIQAMCDLNLPNYMSKIVNVGLQQGGIETAAPDAVSQAGLEFVSEFMSDEEKALVEQNYTSTYVVNSNSYGKGLEEKYPNQKGNQIYILNENISEETRTELNGAFENSTYTMAGFLKTLRSQSGTQQSSTDMSDMDITELYKMQPMLAESKDLISEARLQALDTDESIKSQSAIMFTRAFYKELGVDLGSIQTGYIINIGLMMLLIAVIGGIATVAVSFISSLIASGVARNLRNDIFKKVASFSNAEYDKFSTSSLITRSTNDVMQIQHLLMMGIRMLCYAPIMGVGGIIMAVNKSVSMSWIIATAVIVIIGLIIIIFSIVMPKFKSLQKLVDRLNLVARETLNGLMVIRAFDRGDFEKERFDKANADLTKTTLFVNRTMTFMMPVMMLVMNGISVLIIWVGSQQVSESTMQVGDMMAFMQYALQIIMSFLFISMMFIFIPRASVSAGRIWEIFETEPTITDPENPKPMEESKKGIVEFKNVSFKYEGAEEYALENISFTANPGTTTAFIGSTGSGKSTVANLIPRFYDATEGEVLVGGINVKDLEQSKLRACIGYIPQKSVLMSGTILSNITYGNEDLEQTEVEEVAKVAQALDFILQKENNFDSEIAQGGANVSGGQRQRLAIARALAVKPDIYLFDDSFSALDFNTDAKLRSALKKYTSNGTIIIVAQRVSTIMDSDQIFVIDDGKIVGSGTHGELLKSCKEYYEIAATQLGLEE